VEESVSRKESQAPQADGWAFLDAKDIRYTQNLGSGATSKCNLMKALPWKLKNFS
jgi:hypothetical protein